MGNLLVLVGFCSEEMFVHKEYRLSNQYTPSILVIAWNINNLMRRNVFPGIMENVSKYILCCTKT